MSRANVTVSAIRPPALTRALASSETGRAGSQGLRNVAGAEATGRPRTISGMIGRYEVARAAAHSPVSASGGSGVNLVGRVRSGRRRVRVSGRMSFPK
jgi:hypothetical protein